MNPSRTSSRVLSWAAMLLFFTLITRTSSQDSLAFPSTYTSMSLSLGKNCTKSLHCFPLICVNHVCQPCTTDAQCKSAKNSQYVCKIEKNASVTTTPTNICTHKDLFKPFSGRDLATILLLLVFGAFAAGGTSFGSANVMLSILAVLLALD